MKRLLLTALTAAFLVVPNSASAQPYQGVPDAMEYLQWVGGSGVAATLPDGNRVQVGPYEAYFNNDPGQPHFSIFCVDYLHTAGSTKVFVNRLDGDLTNTRLGSVGQYTQAAYLASLFNSGNEEDWGQIHSAIWHTTGGLNDPGNSFIDDPIPGGFPVSDWYVLTPATWDSDSQQWVVRDARQEFMMRRVSVPEPSTLLLLGTGLLFFYIARRRRFDFLEDNA